MTADYVSRELARYLLRTQSSRPGTVQLLINSKRGATVAGANKVNSAKQRVSGKLEEGAGEAAGNGD